MWIDLILSSSKTPIWRAANSRSKMLMLHSPLMRNANRFARGGDRVEVKQSGILRAVLMTALEALAHRIAHGLQGRKIVVSMQHFGLRASPIVHKDALHLTNQRPFNFEFCVAPG